MFEMTYDLVADWVPGLLSVKSHIDFSYNGMITLEDFS